MYNAKVIERIKTHPNSWGSVLVGVFDAEGNKVGEYKRNYPDLTHTFFPFKQGEQWYALYSPHYTATRVMTLPDCKDIGGEEPSGGGFCPAHYYVPQPKGDDEHDQQYVYNLEDEVGKFGFVAGCVWGDDSSWKIQYIDLSRVAEGIIKRDDRLGYVELPDIANKLEDYISFKLYSKDYPRIEVATYKSLFLDGRDSASQEQLHKESWEKFWAERKADAVVIEAAIGHKVVGWMTGDGNKAVVEIDKKRHVVLKSESGDYTLQLQEEYNRAR